MPVADGKAIWMGGTDDLLQGGGVSTFLGLIPPLELLLFAHEPAVNWAVSEQLWDGSPP